MFLRNLIIIVCIGFLNCAYYNTFYNAKKAFNEGERIRLDQPQADGTIPSLALASYEIAMTNAGLVLRDHSGSSYVDDALVMIGDILAIQGQHQKAINKYEQVLRLFPESKFHPYCVYSSAKSHFGSGNARQADKILERFIREYPGDNKTPDAYILRGEIAFSQESFETAIVIFNLYLDKYPNHGRYGDVLSYLVRSNMKLNRFSRARNLVELNLEKFHSEDLRYQADLMVGESLLREGSYRKALLKFKSLLSQTKFEHKHPEVMLAMAACQIGLDDSDKAISQYKTIINLYEKNSIYAQEVSQAMFELGELYQKSAALELAEKMFGDAIQKSPRSFWVRNQSDQKTRAIRQLRRLHENLKNMESVLLAKRKLKKDNFKDSSDIERLLKNVAGIRFQLAEQYLFQLEMADSALSQYRSIEKESVDSSIAAKAIFAQAWIYDNFLGDSKQASFLYNSITKNYNETPYAAESALLLSKPINGELSEDRMFTEAEQLLFEAGEPDLAYGLYELILIRYPNGVFAPRALLALGWIAETYYSNPQTALELYRRIIAQYPSSDQANSIRNKVSFMERLLLDENSKK
tara:strand:- start:27712 stop:29451 length:1740 start_codon:yes stop_codon:yes gene_type:complete